jgi:Ribonuclease G/E
MSQYDFSHIINITSCRVGKGYDECEHIIMFQWKLIHDQLSNCEFSKIRVKNFGNFEIKKSFLESYKKKLEKKIQYFEEEDYDTTTQRTRALMDDLSSKLGTFQEIYDKYSKHEDIKVD